MELKAVVAELASLGTASYQRILINHGANEPVYGVKIADLKKLERRNRRNHALALELFDTGIYDAQYLAGLIVDDSRMKKADLRRWLSKSNCAVISGTIVAWVAAESPFGLEMARQWLDSKKDNVAQAGWETLSSLVSIRPDADLDLTDLETLLARVEQTMHKQPDLVRYSMNGFIIAVGTYVAALTQRAIQVAERIGVVSVDVGDTACEVPFAPDVLAKLKVRAAIGKKRKTAKC
jgi:3-methyladenine DNA glycosylase AlkD